ncbi:hypothetical protein [Acidipila sp. EB88]|uniref:hypothetical protein n=1 Tax=Acidipila sp. EB88 TaxID=2305226 RepID=UPI000F5E4905|nr:hypothetical protein [Acidipila sp. EB88]RRA49713.1 hypothetical protein D1Y84_17010 [Acidipila sp. EB88]
MSTHIIVKSLTFTAASFAALSAFGQSSNLPVFNVAAYSASGTTGTSSCSGQAGSNVLTNCQSGSANFQVGQGLKIIGGGIASQVSAVTSAPTVTKQGTGASGSHTYCYVVDTVDPLGAISAPSPQACVSGEPTLSVSTTWNLLSTPNATVSGPSPVFLWYVSQDSGPFQLISSAGFYSYTDDVGQRPGTRGGWPNNLPSGNPNIAKNEDFFSYVTGFTDSGATLGDTLTTSFQNLTTQHDDTRAVQNAINAAAAAGGGIVQLNNGTYNLQRPSFPLNGTVDYPTYTTSLASTYWFTPYSYLQIPNSIAGRVHIQGNGTATTLVTTPDLSTAASLFAMGSYQRPTISSGVLKMNEVQKGATQLTLSGGTGSLKAGDDIWLYTGSFNGTPCPDVNGTAGQCHYSELNTVAALSGNTVTLAWPASKHYYDDGSSSFGLVKLPQTAHDIALQNFAVNTYTPILGTGMVYSLLVNNVTINGFVNHGPFGGGFKRDVTFENSTWGFGAGDASYDNTDEYDQFTDVLFQNDTITGYAATGAESVQGSARIYGTEGSSQFVFKQNHLINASLYFDETTDDVVSNNQFLNGMLQVGSAYRSSPFATGPAQNPEFASFDSQASATISGNVFTSTLPFAPPLLLSVGHFDSASVTNNVITYTGAQTMLPAITAYSGTITGNVVTMTNTGSNVGIAVLPDESPNVTAAAFRVTNNAFTGLGSTSIGVYVADPNFTDTAQICVENNLDVILLGLPLYVANNGDVNLGCS